MYKEHQPFIVAGEIVRTSRMYAMSVSPLSKDIVVLVAPDLLGKKTAQKLKKAANGEGRASCPTGKGESRHAQRTGISGSAREVAVHGSVQGSAEGRGSRIGSTDASGEKQPQTVSICGTPYIVQKMKGKKQLLLPWDQFSRTVEQLRAENDRILYDGRLEQLKNLRAKITFGSYELLAGEKFGLVLSVAEAFPLQPLDSEIPFPRTKNFTLPEDTAVLLEQLPLIFRTVAAKQKSKQLGFITLFNDGNGTFWLKTSRGFHTALHENLASLQQLIDSAGAGLDEAQTAAINNLYSKIAKLI